MSETDLWIDWWTGRNLMHPSWQPVVDNQVNQVNNWCSAGWCSLETQTKPKKNWGRLSEVNISTQKDEDKTMVYTFPCWCSILVDSKVPQCLLWAPEQIDSIGEEFPLMWQIFQSSDVFHSSSRCSLNLKAVDVWQLTGWLRIPNTLQYSLGK